MYLPSRWTMRVAVCAAACLLAAQAEAHLSNLVLVVANSGSLSTQENNRKTQFETWGYTVTVLDDGSSQATYDSTCSGKDVVYVCLSASAASVSTKLKSKTIGVVNEHPDLADDFGFANTSYSTNSRNYIVVSTTSHHITIGVSTGNTTILTTNQTLVRRTGTLAGGATTLAQIYVDSSNNDPGLLVIGVGGALYGGGTAAGRRVLLPFDNSGMSFSNLNSTGLDIVKRSIEWAARPNPAIGDLLFVVTSTGSVTSQEKMRQYLMDTWGYNVTLISDSDSQTNFNTQIAANDVAYVSEEVNASDVGTKLKAASIGVVNEDIDLVDEFGFASTRTTTTGTAVSITNNGHYITSGFSTGSLTLYTASNSVAYLSGTQATGLQSLATVSSNHGLCILEKGVPIYSSGVAAGRRVQLPWGGSTFDFADLNTSSKTIMRRAIEWAATPAGTPILLVVKDPDAPTAQEQLRITKFESWGYSLHLIDESASQANYDTALANCGIAYITEEVDSVSVGTKLTNAVVGVINEEPALTDELKIASSSATASGTQVTIANNTHYITSTLSTGALTIFSSSQLYLTLSGTLATEGKTLGTIGGSPALMAIEAGAKLNDGTTAPARRVQLPFGGDSFDFAALNASGQTILQRSLQWAGGLAGYWPLDETSGTTAYDSSGNNNDGTLTGGITFANDSVSGKLGTALDFNGSSDYVTVASNATLQPTTALSISAWIKGDAWGSGSDADPILRKGEDNPNNYQMAIVNGKLSLSLDTGDDTGYSGNTTLSTGVWYHVAATWDGTSIKVYVNGVLDKPTAGTKAAPIGTDTRTLYIGGRGTGDKFDGVIDDVRLFNYALTADEVLSLKGMGQPTGVRIVKWLETQ